MFRLKHIIPPMMVTAAVVIGLLIIGLASDSAAKDVSIAVAVGVALLVLTYYFTYKANSESADVQMSSKIAEFRQKWINNLRRDLAKLNAIHYYAVENKENGASNKHLEKAKNITTRVKLYMNPNDPLYPELCDLFKEYENLNNMDEFERTEKKYIDISQELLKGEWDRLKSDVKGRRI